MKSYLTLTYCTSGGACSRLSWIFLSTNIALSIEKERPLKKLMFPGDKIADNRRHP